MVKSIDVINVGFGDSAIISGNNQMEEYKVLVDCGSKHRYNQQVIDLVNKEFSNNKSYGILSHFHDDHYKFIPKLNRLFDEFYIPNYLNVQTISIQLKTYLLIKNNSAIKKASEAMLRLDKIAKCLKQSGSLIFVSSNQHKTTTIIDDFRVLWPIKGKTLDDSEIDEQLNIFFKKEDLKQIEDYSEKFVSDFEKNSEKVNENQLSIEKSRVINIGESLNNLTSKIIPIEDAYDSNNLYIIDGKEKIEDKSKKKPSQLITKPIYIDWSIKEGILRNQHHYCLVFDRINDDSFHFIFLGDLDKNIIQNNIISNISNDHYKYMKVVHHGTGAYFLSHLPKTDNFIICNKLWGTRSSWKIDEQYPNNYSNSNFICTNNNGCYYYSVNGTCPNGKFCGFANQLYNHFK